MKNRKSFALTTLIILIVVLSIIVYGTTSFVVQSLRMDTIRVFKHQSIMAAQAGVMKAAYEALQNGTYANAEANLSGTQWYKYAFNASPSAGAGDIYINASASSQTVNTTIVNWTIVNNSTEAGTITSIQLSWLPASNNLTSVTVNSTNLWSGTSASGGIIDIPDVNVPASTTLTGNILVFSGNMSNVSVYATLFFADGSAITRRVWKAQSAVLPDGGPWYPTGMRSWWKMNENSGTTVFDLINPNGANPANNLTLGGGATWTSSGKFGSAVAFNGANNAELTGSNSNSLTNSVFSVSAWIYLNSLPTTTSYGIISRGMGGPPITRGYELYVNNNTDATVANRRKIIWAIGPNGTSYKAVSPSVPATATWIHVAGTYDGSNARLYIDGALNATIAAPTYSANGTFYIGNRINSNNTNFNGRIDEAAFFYLALTDAEVLAIYTPNSGTGGTPTLITSTGKFVDGSNNVLMRQTMLSTFEVTGSAMKIKQYNETTGHLMP